MGKSKEFTEEEKDFMVYNYTILKRGVNAIGKDLKVCGTTVQRHLKKMGVKIRNFEDAMQECRKYNVNDNYFKTQSHNMAYILGLLASDGCISKNSNHWYIDLQTKDEQILYDIKKEIAFEGPIEHYMNNQGVQYSRLRVCSKTMKEDLSHYGVVPSKTFLLTPPIFLNDYFYISYIRGYFDGDGCVYINYEKYSYNWYICGARKVMLEWINRILLSKYGIRTTLQTAAHSLSNGDNFYYLQIYKKEAILKLFQILYIQNSLYLERKYDIMKNFYDIKSTRPCSLSVKEKRYAELIQNKE